MNWNHILRVLNFAICMIVKWYRVDKFTALCLWIQFCLLTLGACASEGYSSWSVCVCLSVCPVEMSFYVRLHQPDIVPTFYK